MAWKRSPEQLLRNAKGPKARREARRKRGQCGNCAQPSGRFKNCKFCRDWYNEQRSGRSGTLAQARKAMAKQLEKRRAAGLCIQCGKAKAPSRCAPCKADNADSTRRYREREKEQRGASAPRVHLVR